jgi:hypothetical protein
MRRYSVQECDRVGNTGAPLEIYADSEIKAGEMATGMKLRQRDYGDTLLTPFLAEVEWCRARNSGLHVF